MRRFLSSVCLAGMLLAGAGIGTAFAQGASSYITNSTNLLTGGNFNISGAGAAGIFNAGTIFQIGGGQVLSIMGTNNLFIGPSTGGTGSSNLFAGYNAGLANAGGFYNAFAGAFAGNANTSGNYNTFFGSSTGASNSTGSNNTGIGSGANVTGNNSNSTALGASATASGANATAIGYNATAAADNTVQLGNTSVTAVNTSGVYQIGANTVLSVAGTANLFAGVSGGTGTGSSNLFAGSSAGNANTSGSGNAFGGTGAGRLNTSGTNNSFFGLVAGQSTATGTENTAIGHTSGATGGGNNYTTSIGAYSSVAADSATAVGYGASASASNSTAVGNSASVSNPNTVQLGNAQVVAVNTSGAYQIGGANAISTVGAANVFVGAGVAQTGSSNMFIGYTAGGSNTTGTYNAFSGAYAGGGNTSGQNNAFFGGSSGASTTTGSYNTAIGSSSNIAGTALQYGTALGYSANVGANNSTAIGANAAANNPNSTAIGNGATVSTDNTIQLGNTSVVGVNTSGNYQIGGANAISTAGAANVFVGAGVAQTGSSNMFAGYTAGGSNSTGTYNAFVGAYAGGSNSTGQNNAYFGASSGASPTTGSYNTAIGSSANITGGATNATALGYGSTAGYNNSTAIGNGASTTVANSVELGNGDVTLVHSAGAFRSGNSLTMDGTTTPRALTGDATLNITTSTGDIDLNSASGMLGVGTTDVDAAITAYAQGAAGTAEPIMHLNVSDALNDAEMRFENGTALDGQFIPEILGYRYNSTTAVLSLQAQLDNSGLDAGTDPLMKFGASIAGTDQPTTRPLFQWYTFNASTPVPLMTMAASGNVGIGTTTPSASLDVASTVRFEGLTGTGTNIVTIDGSGNLGSTSGSGAFINNSNSEQSGATFNIGGDGTVGGTLYATNIEDVGAMLINTSSNGATTIGNTNGGTSITGTGWSIDDPDGSLSLAGGNLTVDGSGNLFTSGVLYFSGSTPAATMQFAAPSGGTGNQLTITGQAGNSNGGDIAITSGQGLSGSSAGNIFIYGGSGGGGTLGDVLLDGSDLILNGDDVLIDNGSVAGSVFIGSNGSTGISMDVGNTSTINIGTGNAGEEVFIGTSGSAFEVDGSGNLTANGSATINGTVYANDFEDGPVGMMVNTNSGGTTLIGNSSGTSIMGQGWSVSDPGGSILAGSNNLYIDNVGNLSTTGSITANSFSGDGSNLTNINGSNVSEVGEAFYADNAGSADETGYADEAGYADEVDGSNVSGPVAEATLADNVHGPNNGNFDMGGYTINNGFGNLSGLTVSGGNFTVDVGGNVTGNSFSGDGSNLTNINGSNVSGPVGEATTADNVSGPNGINFDMGGNTIDNVNALYVNEINPANTDIAFGGDVDLGGHTISNGNCNLGSLTVTGGNFTVDVVGDVVANGSLTAGYSTLGGLTVTGGNFTVDESGNLVADGTVRFTGLTGGGTNIVTIDGGGNLGASDGSGSFIENSNSLQSGANFNIGGNGTIGGTLYATDIENNPVGLTINTSSGGTTTIGNSAGTSINGNVGIGTATPSAALEVDGTILGNGTSGGDPNLGNATMMMWVPSEAAFRAGIIDDGNHEWDAVNVGTGSTAFGHNTVANGQYSTALGESSGASGHSSVAMGTSTFATGDYTIAMGDNASTANYSNSFVYGDGSTATDNDAPNQFMVRASGGYKLFYDNTSNPVLAMASGNVAVTASGSVTVNGESIDLEDAVGMTLNGAGTGQITIGNTSDAGITMDVAGSNAIAIGTGGSGEIVTIGSSDSPFQVDAGGDLTTSGTITGNGSGLSNVVATSVSGPNTGDFDMGTHDITDAGSASFSGDINFSDDTHSISFPAQGSGTGKALSITGESGATMTNGGNINITGGAGDPNQYTDTSFFGGNVNIAGGTGFHQGNVSVTGTVIDIEDFTLLEGSILLNHNHNTGATLIGTTTMGDSTGSGPIIMDVDDESFIDIGTNGDGETVTLGGSNDWVGIGAANPAALFSVGSNSQLTVDGSGNLAVGGNVKLGSEADAVFSNAVSVSGTVPFAVVTGSTTDSVTVTVGGSPSTGQILYLNNNCSGGHSLSLGTSSVAQGKMGVFIFNGSNWVGTN